MSTTPHIADQVVLVAPLLGPLAAGVAGGLLGWRRSVAWAAVAASSLILLSGVLVGMRTVGGGAIGVGTVLRADALTAVMLLVIGVVGVIATWSGVTYIERELADGHTDERGARLYALLVPAFLAAMVLAVLADNLGVVWAAVEATTIVTAFLVGHRRTRASLEATWKYVMICSVGIAMAYLGTVLVYYASKQATGGAGSLSWTVLAADGGQLDSGVMRVAVALLVLGFGTKAGLVPMHSWLPDAHSQAPAPVSALMSGVLLSVAVYALLRYRVIAVEALDPRFVRNLLLVVALASLALAASLLISQRDYKRLLAYSSIEHMGLVVVGVAIGTPLAVAALLLHILGHGVGKAVLFCTSGQILAAEGTTEIAQVRGLLARQPVLAGSFAVGIAALLGLPPFSLFLSELALMRAAASAGMGWVIAPTLVLLVVVFLAVARHTVGMLFGDQPAPAIADNRAPHPMRMGRLESTPLVLGLVLLATIGVVAWPLQSLLRAAAASVGSP